MTRKKPGLWLNRPNFRPIPKRRHAATPTKTVTPKRLKTADTSFHSSCKRQSISKSSTPKRQRVFSPHLQTFSPTTVFSPLRSCSKLHQLIDSVSDKLKLKGLDQEFTTFLTLVSDDKFPLDNLSFLLFLETDFFQTNEHPI